MGEDAKVAIRNIRRDANDAFKKLAKEDVSEDEIKDLEGEVQKLTDKYIKEIEKAVNETNTLVLKSSKHIDLFNQNDDIF